MLTSFFMATPLPLVISVAELVLSEQAVVVTVPNYPKRTMANDLLKSVPRTYTKVDSLRTAEHWFTELFLLRY
jgi:hypothetical protein